MDTTSLIKIYKKELADALDSIPYSRIDKFYRQIECCYRAQSTLYVCANGGSVGAVHNFVTDMNLHPFTLSDKTKTAGSRNGFKCVNLCSDTATITGIMNDKGPDYIYSEQLRYQMVPFTSDTLVCMSGSGNSPNILKAFEFAKKSEWSDGPSRWSTVLITRNKNAKANEYADLILCVDSYESQFPGQQGSNNNNFYFEDILFSLTHMVCGMLKRYIGND